MKLYKSKEPNTFHYVTLVTLNPVPVFLRDEACKIFVDVLGEVRVSFPFKLIGYVLMPDHVSPTADNRIRTISQWLHRVRGNSARRILGWLRDERHLMSLKKLELANRRKRQHTHAVWQKDPSVTDLWSHKFIRKIWRLEKLEVFRSGLPPARSCICNPGRQLPASKRCVCLF